MFQMFVKIKNYIPYDCYKTVYDIDYNKLYDQGKRIILMDLDNTLIPYDVSVPDENLIKLLNDIQNIGFRIIFISNNRKKRVADFSNIFNFEYIHGAWKPWRKGYRKAFKMIGHKNTKEIIAIGDQVMTDVLGANRMKIECILVKPLKIINEKWYTKLNRTFENRVVKRLEKDHPEIYHKIKDLKDI